MSDFVSDSETSDGSMLRWLAKCFRRVRGVVGGAVIP
jgi:hypothetical protein